MKRSAGGRFELVIQALSAAPATAQQLSDQLGVTYSNVYYVLRTLKDLNQIHIQKWVHVGSVQKPAAVYAVGKSSQSVSEEVTDVSAVSLSSAISSWIKGDDHGNEIIPSETGLSEGLQRETGECQ